MATDTAETDVQPPNISDLPAASADEFFDVKRLSRLERVIANGVQTAVANSFGALLASSAGIGALLAKGVREGERVAAPLLAPILASAIQSMFGVDFSPAQLADIENSGARRELGVAVGKSVIDAINTGAGELQPSEEPAVKFMGMLSHVAIDGWAQSVIIEWLLSACGVVHEVEAIGKLVPDLVDTLGLGRMARVALRPLVQHSIATPLDWKVSKQLRPTLLGESTLARAMLRSPGDAALWQEQFARRGFSDRNIAEVVNEQRKFLGVGDVRELLIRGEWSNDIALQHLLDQGYDEQTARDSLRVEGVKRISTQDRSLVDAALTAYADGRIDRATFTGTIGAWHLPSSEEAFTTELGDARRALRVLQLSPAEAAACAKVGILAVADYRATLERVGYTADAVYALELLLRHEIDVKLTIAQHKAAQDADRAAATKAREEKAAQREADIAARHALALRGSIPELKAAVVRGLIPIVRYVDVLSAHYDADTVQILVGLAEDARQVFLAQQQKAADAAKRAADKHLNVGQLEQAVLDNVIDLSRYRMGLDGRGLSADDINILVATITQKKKDHDAAVAKRAAAEAKAKGKGVSLTTFEALVRAGHRTMAEFDRLLVSLGEDDVARAAIEELLSIKIAADARAAGVKAGTIAALKAKGLSLDQFRRAVILGIQSVDDYGRFLLTNGVTTDAQAVLVAEVRDAVVQAQAAQQRRLLAARAKEARAVPLATATRAARLGLITLEAYQARLVKAGYSPDDVTIEMDLLLMEIADLQAKRDEGGAAAASVAADVTATLAGAAGLHAQVASALTAKHLSLAKLEQAVTDGLLTIDGYITEVEQNGFDADDAELLGALLTSKLAAAAGTPATPSPKVSRKKAKPPAPPAGG
jgi:hypothetical protein